MSEGKKKTTSKWRSRTVFAHLFLFFLPTDPAAEYSSSECEALFETLVLKE
jgi:hypothetical protein